MTDTGVQVKPCPPQTALDGVTCRRCQRLNPVGLNRCEQCKSVLKGNKLAATHGLRAAERRDDLDHLHAEVDAFAAGCVADEAEGHDIPTRRRALLGYRARLHRRITQLDDALEIHGLVDRRGRLRSAWLQQLQGLMATAKALDTLLGLERRVKRVPTLSEVMSAPGGAAHGD